MMHVYAGLTWASQQPAAPSQPEHVHRAGGRVGGEVATGFSSSASQHLGLLETTETLGLTLHLGSKLLVIFPPTWNPPDPVSRVLAYATLASLSRSVFLWLGAH